MRVKKLISRLTVIPPLARVSKKEYAFMEPALDFLQNVISPQQEMSAYETLWAMENIKESELKESKLKKLFRQYTPTEVLKMVSNPTQLSLLSQKNSDEQIKEKVNRFLKKIPYDSSNAFSIVVNKSAQYPDHLINDYPIGLFYYKGNLDLLGGQSISIVGTRKASKEGLSKAKQLVKELKKDFIIVSGLAKGIDTVAHKSAIEQKGWTIGVIGTPINEYYPEENKGLQDKIAKDFLLISQVPFYKYAHEPFKHRAYHFPRRNMTMASISSATVIVEAGDSSGTLVQARECLKQNKKLFILDSCFDNSQIKWPAKFLKKGAIRVKDTSDILNHLSP